MTDNYLVLQFGLYFDIGFENREYEKYFYEGAD